ncbi:hypothetical protein [Bifidobacterium simiarum]|uniref:hypothetical protein n=1 Tax=Bifidobacterium simiarum TaxID=2045441 RepID=UPI001BDC5587|nr:hypothetical protein [Bifidobacterium simiarum]MBT1166191.1 hypothetical protein [Bifidobacterium simiarum]
MNVILAFIDHIYGVNESTTAVNVRLETLRGIALGLRNLDNYIIRSLLFRIGGFRQIIQTTSAQQKYEDPENDARFSDDCMSAFWTIKQFVLNRQYCCLTRIVENQKVLPFSLRALR